MAPESEAGQPGVQAKPPRRRLRRALTAFLAVALVLLAAAPLAGAKLTSFFFGPHPGPVEPPADPHCDVTSFTAQDGAKLEGWWFPSTAPGPVKAVVLVAHGNGWNLEKQWKHVVHLLPHGFDVLVFDYRGFGDSGGGVTRAHAREDVLSALDVAKQRAAQEHVPVVVLGQSMGAALACEALARRDDVAAIVLDSPFSSWSGIASDAVASNPVAHALAHGLLGWALIGTGHDPIDTAPELKAPVLIVSGEADEITPPRMARALVDACHAQLLSLPGAPHVGGRTKEDEAKVADAEVSFFEKAVARR
jgi:alpha-beta hydrolase superfamily lysophospholipase